MKTELTIEEIKEYFSYSPETGQVFWKKRPSNRVLIGAEVGNHNDQGYKICRFKGKALRVHHIVWALNTEELPKRFIDHINGKRDDNRIENLRIVSNSENLQNMKQARGYTYHKKLNKWMAKLSVNKEHKYLGVFETEKEAHEAYLSAKRKYHPFFVEESNG